MYNVTIHKNIDCLMIILYNNHINPEIAQFCADIKLT